MLFLSSRITMALTTLLTVVWLAAEAGAVPVQIGNTPTLSGNIDGGTPTNVDRNAPMLLAAGTYTITNFNSAVTATNGVKGLVPFLVTGTPSTYTTIWVGPTFTPNTNGLQNVTYAPLTQTFTLLSPTTVYAGANTINGPLLDFIGGGSTDHDGSPGFGPIALNQVLTGFSNPGLGRIYSFNLVVDLVPIPAPEPSSLALLSLGMVGVISHRRRSNRQHQASI
jgi:hypothetical protein